MNFSRKFLAIAGFALLSYGLFQVPAFADDEDPPVPVPYYQPFQYAYIGVQVYPPLPTPPGYIWLQEQESFAPNERPWLFLQLAQPINGFSYTTGKIMITTEWYMDGELAPRYSDIKLRMPPTPGSDQFFFISPDNWFDINPPGYHVWTVKSSYQYMQQPTDGDPWFSVTYGNAQNVFYTPEPVSSALFLLGAGALTVRRLRKKKSA